MPNSEVSTAVNVTAPLAQPPSWSLDVSHVVSLVLVWVKETQTKLQYQLAGIADGVGGWSLSNIDSGVYSRMLMRTAQAAALITPPSPIAPQIILEEAHARTNVKVGNLHLTVCTAHSHSCK